MIDNNDFLVPPLGLTFKDLYTLEGLIKIDNEFINYLDKNHSLKANKLRAFRLQEVSPEEMTSLIIDLGPLVDEFIRYIFQLEKEFIGSSLKHELVQKILLVQRQFVQRYAVKKYALATNVDIISILGDEWTELDFSLKVLELENSSSQEYEILAQYAAWATLTKEGQEKHPHSILFRVRQSFYPDKILEDYRGESSYKSSDCSHRDGFNLTDPGLSFEQTLDQAKYCITCHKQGKDSCSRGFLEGESYKRSWARLPLSGCPLKQKISEMMLFKQAGLNIAALATAMIDNPLIPATGHRICNDCMRSCIFQKQEAVNVPGVETQILKEVLDYPWGVEIYSLFTRWNPLNFRNPLPKTPTGYNVLIAGMGPAGFTLAHYLLNEGHGVVGIDGLKIEPFDIPFEPVKHWKNIEKDLEERSIDGFGGVMEFGITNRWNKNFLKLIRLVLERRPAFKIFGGVRLGGTIKISQAFEKGFDHVALCLGAGRPVIFKVPGSSAKGVRYASDFLMSLQLGGAFKPKSLTNFPLRMPIIVVGAGLTAIDTATEAAAYYFRQLEKFRSYWLSRKDPFQGLNEEEQEIARTFLLHLKELDESSLKPHELIEKWGGVTILCRGNINESPSYRINHEELLKALEQGITIIENMQILSFEKDNLGWVNNVRLKSEIDNLSSLQAKTVLLATGMKPNASLDEDETALPKEDLYYKAGSENDFLLPNQAISFWGDLHPQYAGSVVKAMASVKNGYENVSKTLFKKPPASKKFLGDKLDFESQVRSIKEITSDIFLIEIYSPFAAHNYKPGHIFRLQCYLNNNVLIPESIPVSPVGVNKKEGTLQILLFKKGASSVSFLSQIKLNAAIVLMGPSGTAVALNDPTFMIAEGPYTYLFAPYGDSSKHKIVGVTDTSLIKVAPELAKGICWIKSDEIAQTLQKARSDNYRQVLIKGGPSFLKRVSKVLDQEPFAHIKASVLMPMQCMMKGICAQCLLPTKDTKEYRFCCIQSDWPIDLIDMDLLHERSRQNTLMEKLSLEQ